MPCGPENVTIQQHSRDRNHLIESSDTDFLLNFEGTEQGRFGKRKARVGGTPPVDRKGKRGKEKASLETQRLLGVRRKIK